MGSELVLDWCQALGWSRNPFTSADHSGGLCGLSSEREELNIFLLKGRRVGYILGGKGAGKTCLLHWLEEQLRDHKSVFAVCIDGAGHPEPAALAPILLHPVSGFFDRGRKVPPAEVPARLQARLKKPCILLVDNADLLSKPASDWIASLRAVPRLTLIATQTEPHPQFGPDELGLKLGPLSDEALREMLARRLAGVGSPDIWPFTDEHVAQLARQAGHNPARFLAACEEKAIALAIQVRRGEVARPGPHHSAAPHGKGFSIKLTTAPRPSPDPSEEPSPELQGGHPKIDTIDFSPPTLPEAEPEPAHHAHHQAHKAGPEPPKGRKLPLPNPLSVLSSDEPPEKEKELRKDGFVLD